MIKYRNDKKTKDKQIKFNNQLILSKKITKKFTRKITTQYFNSINQYSKLLKV